MKETTLAIIPTYNECDNIGTLYEQLRNALPDVDILFVDDNSPDGTAQRILELQASDSTVHLVKRAGKLGVGSAHRDGILWAYKHGYSRVATMDADLTHSPSVLPKMIEWCNQVDIVVASRFLRPGSLPGWSLFRKFLTGLGHLATRFILKIRFDATGGLRVYNIKNIPIQIFQKTKADGYAFLFESLYLLVRNGTHIVEMPITLPARTLGSSKMNGGQVVESILHLLRLYLFERTCPEVQELKSKERHEGAATVSRADGAEVDAWGSYWSGSERPPISQLLYEIASTLVRTWIIRPQLNRVAGKVFPLDSRLLHAGCGSGQVDRQLRSRFSIEAIDLSPSAVEQYNELNEPMVSARKANIMALPFEDSTFDGVYNLGVMEHFTDSDICAALREFRRVLRPNGKLLLFWPPKRSVFGFALRFFGLIRQDEKAGKQAFIPPEINLLDSSAQIQRWLSQEGFLLQSCKRDWRDFGMQYAVVGIRTEQ